MDGSGGNGEDDDEGGREEWHQPGETKREGDQHGWYCTVLGNIRGQLENRSIQTTVEYNQFCKKKFLKAKDIHRANKG